eukprot:8913534-Pyramimonas_sp.AAC.1
MLPDGKMVIRGRETRVQATTRPDRILPERWKTLSCHFVPSTTEERNRICRRHNKPARHVSGLPFGRGPDRTNELYSFAQPRPVDLHGIPWNAVLLTIWTAALSFETRKSRA